MTGWVCPVCGESNAPFNTACIRGPHARVITTTTTYWPAVDWGSANCSCETTARCMVHNPPKPQQTVNSL